MNIINKTLSAISHYLASYKQKLLLRKRSADWITVFKGNKKDRDLLSEEQIKQVKDYYGRFDLCFDVDTVFHDCYLEKSGKFDVRYFPDNIYYCYVDPYYNNWEKARYIDNKCTYPRMFPNVKQPENVLTRMNGVWTDSEYKLVSDEEICSIVGGFDELVVKQANESVGGKAVFFVNGESIVDDFKKVCEKIKKDIVVQKVIKQHPVLSTLNPTSINTIRIMSMLKKDGVKIYSSLVRMGVNKSRVDNSSSGGISCGINPDGRLNPMAFSDYGDRFDCHPTSGLHFETIVIPSYDKACEMVKKLHPSIPDFRLVSWDISISEDGEPILVEANLCYGGVDFHQFSNGPIFKDDTEEILQEVFGKSEK